jgi:hypothetical protein
VPVVPAGNFCNGSMENEPQAELLHHPECYLSAQNMGHGPPQDAAEQPPTQRDRLLQPVALSRRGFLAELAVVIAAPAVVKALSLMPIRGEIIRPHDLLRSSRGLTIYQRAPTLAGIPVNPGGS